MAGRATLGKKERLKSRKLIGELFSDGKRMSVPPFRINYVFKAGSPDKLQAGVTVSTRNFKKASDRNKIKRQTREAWRLQKTALNETLKGDLAVFFIYTEKELPVYADLHTAVGKVIQQLIKKVS
jgi:ribonuclease P protein component